MKIICVLEVGNAIVMDPKTGDILAMASYPDYDLNTPFTPISSDLSSVWDKLSSQKSLKSLTNCGVIEIFHLLMNQVQLLN